MHEGFPTKTLNSPMVENRDDMKLEKIESQIEAIDKAIKEAEDFDGDSLLNESINNINSILSESLKDENHGYSHDVEQLKHLKNELLKAKANLEQKKDINIENQANTQEKETVLVTKNK